MGLICATTQPPDPLADLERSLGSPTISGAFDTPEALEAWRSDANGTWQIRDGVLRGRVDDRNCPELATLLLPSFRATHLLLDVRLRVLEGISAYGVFHRSDDHGECWGKNRLNLARRSSSWQGRHRNIDVPFEIEPKTWHRFRVAAIGARRYYFADNYLVAKSTVAEPSDGLVGVGMYRSRAEFDDLKVYRLSGEVAARVGRALAALPVTPTPPLPPKPWQTVRDFSPSASPFQIRPGLLSREELMATYLEALKTFICRFAQPWFTMRKDIPNAGYYRCPPDLNPGWLKWNNCSMSLALAILLTEVPDQQIQGIPRERLLAQAIAVIRLLAACHVTGEYRVDFPHTKNGKWGNNWDSAWTVGGPGNAAWYLWEHLDKETREWVTRMALYEANRQLKNPVPAREWSDTHADPDAWNTHALALAINMLPDHEHQSAWRQKLSELIVNTFATPQDAQNQTVIDDRPVREWVNGANFHRDYTLENHGFFHPFYHQAAHGQVAMSAVCFLRSQQPLPDAYRFAWRNSWRTLALFTDGTGEFLMPQGQDWPLHNVGGWPGWVFFSHQGCRGARAAESVSVQYLKARQAFFGDGRLRSPAISISAYEFASTDWLGRAYLLHKYLGEAGTIEPTQSDFVKEISRAEYFPYCQFLVNRTPQMFSSFSWRYQCMGVVEPERSLYPHSPWLTWPATNGLRGSYAVKGKKSSWKVVSHREELLGPDQISTTGHLRLCEGALHQYLSFTSLAPNIVVYLDRVVAAEPITLRSHRGVPLGIENSEFNGHQRTLFSKHGSRVVTGYGSTGRIPIDGSWVNVDDRLGLILMAGAAICYLDTPRYSSGIIRDTLCGSMPGRPDGGQTFAAGATVATHIAIILAGENHSGTMAVTASARRIDAGPIGQGVQFEVNGKEILVVANLSSKGGETLTSPHVGQIPAMATRALVRD